MKTIIILFFLVIASITSVFSQINITTNPNPPTICNGSSVILTANGGTTPYTWTPATGLNVTTGATVIATPTATITYTVTGTGGGKDSVKVTVHPNPVANFTFSPNNSPCANIPISFTNTSTGTGLTYSWNFGDPTSSNNTSTLTNPSHTFYSAIGNGTKPFIVTLTVKNSYGCTNTITNTVTVNKRPNACLTSTNATTTFFNGDTTFYRCASGSQTQSNFMFNNASTPSSGLNYTIIWGDGQTYTSSNWTATSHVYNIGNYNLLYIVENSNGCIDTAKYKVFFGSQPAGGIVGPGNESGCSPRTLSFTIANTNNNPPGTIYTVTFNDGTQPVVFTNAPPSSIPHTFILTSCGFTSSDGTNTYQNAFSATFIAQNPCGTKSGAVVPIYISIPAHAGFTTSPGNVTCVNTPITFSDTTHGMDILQNHSCNSTPPRLWVITPLNGWTTSGNLGQSNGFIGVNFDPYSWNPGSQNLTVNFTLPGTYTISMLSGNNCGPDSIKKTVCIVSPPAPSFTLDSLTGCIPLQVAATNTTSILNSCGTATYNWTISYTATNCGTSALWSFTNGTSVSSINPSFVFNNPGTYTVALAVTNKCSTISTNKTVVVKKPPNVTITSVPVNCGPVNISPIANVTKCGTNTPTYAWTFSGGTPANSNQANPVSISFSSVGSHTISLSVTNECGTTTATNISFDILQQPTANVGSNSPICAGSTINLTSSGGSGYLWSGPNGYSSPSQNPTIPNATVANSGTYTVTVTAANSCTNTAAVTVIVNNVPTFTTQPTSSNVCIGGMPTMLSVAFTNGVGTPTYQWYSNSSNSTNGGTPIPGAINATYQPPASVAGTTYYYCIISFSSGGCSMITSTVAQVVVNPNPTISTQPTPTQSLCIGGILPVTLSVSYTGGTGTASYQWYSNSTPSTSGGMVITGATSSTYTPPVYSTAGTYYYYVVVTLSGSGCGSTTSNLVTITVLPDPVISAQPLSSQSLCQNATPTSLSVTITGGVGSSGYQWYSNIVNNTTTGTIISGASSASYIPPTSTVGTLYYYCIITQSGSGCSVTSTTAAVIVKNAPTFTTQPASSSVCIGGVPTLLSVAFTNGTGTSSYQWYSNTINSLIGGTLISGATNATYQPPASVAGTTYYYCIITFSSGGCSNITSNIAQVVINPGTTISTQPTPNQNLCVGGTLPTALSVSYTGGTGTVSYQWYSNTTSSTIGGTIITGATLSTYTPPVYSTASTYYYYVVVTLSGSGCGSTTSNLVTIAVLPDPVVSAQPLSSQSLCQTATPSSLSVTITGGTGTASYQWYSNTFNNTTTGTIISGASSASYIPPTSTVGTLYYYCIITQSGSGCSVTSTTAAVIVKNAPTFTTQPLSSNICIGGVPTLLSVAFTNGTGTSSYQWYSNTINSPIGGTSISGAINATFQPPASVAGTTYYYCIISFSSGGCSNITSNIAQVVINPGTTISTQPTPNQNLCVGGTLSTALSVSYTGGTGTASYQWYSNNTPSTSGGTIITGSTSTTYTPPVYSTAGTYYYYVVIILGGSGCGSTTSNLVTVNVFPDPVVSAQPLSSQSLCQTATPAGLSVTITGGTGTASYQWYSNTVNNTTTGTIISGASSVTYIPPTSTVGTLYYYCIITQSGSGCSVTSTTAAVIVKNAPTFTTQPISSNICIGDVPTMLSVAFTNGTGTSSYQWYSNAINSPIGGTSISGAINATYQPPYSIVGTTYYYCIITFSSGGCSNITSSIAQVVINSIPTVTQPIDQVVCSGSQTTIIYFIGTGTSYAWTNNTPSIGLGASGTGDISPFAAINTGTTPLVATITVTPQYTNVICPGPPKTFTITINPTPVIPSQTATICSGDAFTVNPVNNPPTTIIPAGTTYTWGVPVSNPINAITGGSAQSIGQTSISQTLTNATNNPATATYTVTSISGAAGNCVGSPVTVVVSVNPLPVVNAGPPDTVCNQPIPDTLMGYLPPNGTWSGTGITSSGIFTPSIAGIGSWYLVYIYTDANGCTNKDSLKANVINPTTADAGTGFSICENSPPVTLTGYTPPGGKWSGAGVTDSIFNPATAGIGNFILTYSIGSGSCLSTDTINVIVKPLPNVTVNSPAICTGQSVTLTALGANTYIWSNNDTINTIIVGPVNTTNYSVTGTNLATGCSKLITSTVTVNQLPNVYAGPNQQFCNQNIPIQLTGFTPVGGTWSGNGVNSSGSFTPSLAGVGSWNLVYTYTDGNGCTNKDSLTAKVISAAIADAGTGFSRCINASPDTLKGSPSGGSWTGTGVTDSIFNPATAGAGNFVLTYSIGSGTCLSTDTINVTVNPLPIVIVSASPNPICYGASSNLTASGAFAYTWSNGGGNSQTVTPDTSTIYTVTGTDNNGCSNSATSLVAVIPLPVVNAGPSIIACNLPIPDTLMGYSPPGGKWSGADVTSSGIFTASYAGNVILTYSYIDTTTGCSNQDTLIVTVVNPAIADAGTGFSCCIDASPVTLTGTPPLGTWSGAGLTGNTFNPATAGAGNFVLTYSYGVATCLSTDTIMVTVKPLPNVTVNSPTICEGQSVTLTANGATSYSWLPSTGLNTTVGGSVIANPITTTAYTITSTLNGCTSNTDAIVTVKPAISTYLGDDADFCPDSTVILDAGNPGSVYLWSTGDITQAISVSNPGTYWVVVNNGPCMSTDTIKFSPITDLNLGRTVSLCGLTEVTLQSNITANSYLWSTGDTVPAIVVQDPGEYWLTVKHDKCVMSDTIQVTGGYTTLYVPNAFTPAGDGYPGDGLNDIFIPKGAGMDEVGVYKYYDFMIFDRWGNKIFETENLTKGWNGKNCSGDFCELGLYVWVINYRTVCSGDRLLQRIGAVLLVR